MRDPHPRAIVLPWQRLLLVHYNHNNVHIGLIVVSLHSALVVGFRMGLAAGATAVALTGSPASVRYLPCIPARQLGTRRPSSR